MLRDKRSLQKFSGCPRKNVKRKKKLRNFLVNLHLHLPLTLDKKNESKMTRDLSVLDRVDQLSPP